MMCLLTRAIFVSAILLTVEAVCNAPTNYLAPTTDIFDDISAGGDITHVYTDTFINCSGCVVGLSACYRDYIGDPNSMAVFILNEQNTIIHVHNFVGPANSSIDTVCEDYGSFRICCTNQTLTENEQFVVDSSQHYGVWSEEDMSVHFYKEAPGHYIVFAPIEVGQNVNHTIHTDSVEKMFFHLIINPGNCSNVSSLSTEVPPQPTSVVVTTASTNLLGYSSNISNYTTTPTITTSNFTISDINLSNTSTQLLYLPTYSSQAVQLTESLTISYTSTLETSALSSNVSVPTSYMSTTLHPLSSNMIETDTNTAVEKLPIVLLASAIGVLVGIGLILMFIILLLIRSRSGSKTISKRTTSQRNKGLSMNEQEKTRKLPQAMEMDINLAYTSTNLNTTTDEIYSYIPNEEDQMQSWTGSSLITTSQNEAYITSLATQEKSSNGSQNRAKSGNSDYVINSLVYDTTQEPPPLPSRGGHKDDNEYVVNQLVYDTADTENKQSKPDIDMIVNEAYVVTNRTNTASNGVNVTEFTDTQQH